VNSKRRTVFDLDSLEELTGGCPGCLLVGMVWRKGRGQARLMLYDATYNGHQHISIRHA
jgi:hypothetical protein